MGCLSFDGWLLRALLFLLIVMILVFADDIYRFFFVKYKMNHVNRITKLSPFTQKEAFDVNYEKELNLFKSLGPNEQSQYLGLSKDAKIAQYGTKLM